VDDEADEVRGREAIARNVQVALEELGPLVEGGLRLDRDGVAWVEGYLERLRGQRPLDPYGALASVLGSFLGQCLVEATGARWVHVEGRWAVVFANGAAAFPLDKVAKQVADGLLAGESILSFYDISVEHVATGRLGRDG
jgi:hypothetical protein